ncbi:MAG: hypothetical protein Q8P83_01340 [bacterium]|nr:hypothetical protein [bacterium]
MLELSAEEYEGMCSLRECGVLTDAVSITEEYRNVAGEFRNSIFFGCPDSERLHAKLVFHGGRLGQLLHPLGPNGGLMAAHPQSPLTPEHISFPLDYYVFQIQQAGVAKATRSLSGYIHTPCGVGRMHGLTIFQQIELALIGRGVLDVCLGRTGLEFNVVPYHTVHLGEEYSRGGDLDKTFGISREAWVRHRDRWAEDIQSLPVRLIEFVTV